MLLLQCVLLPKVNGFSFDALGMVYAGPWFFLCNLSLSVIYVIFTISLQITELQKDRVKVGMAMIEKVLANLDKETTELIRAAQEDYESEYVFLYLSMGHIWTLSACTWVHFLSIFWLITYSCPSELPANEKLHDLVSLLNFDSSKVSGEMLGEESIWCHQRILQEHCSVCSSG